jgi:hypothetical protein
MNAKTKSWLARGMGTFLGAAAIAVFVAILQQGDTRSVQPRVTVTKLAVVEEARLDRPPLPQLVDAMFGRAIVEFIGVGFGLGLLAFGLSRVAAYRRESRRVPLGARLTSSRAAKPIVLVAVPRVADATASEFDDIKRPSFAPVTSLTEAQVRLRRGHRQAQRRRAVPTGA